MTMFYRMFIAPLPLVAVSIILYFLDNGCEAKTTISVTAPVNPVDEYSILSVHCQIWNLQPDQEVGIYRNRSGERQGRIERLSLDNVVHTEDNNNVFLAERQMMDGSVVFFLSIIEATRYDEGEYFCMISTVAGLKGVSDSVRIDFKYFPPDSDPVCTPNERITVNDGVNVQFDCSSALGNPIVNFEWKIADGSSSVLSNSVKTREINGRRHSTLTITPSKSTSGAVFICTIRSSAFPTLERTCHVGPLTVLHDGTPYPVVGNRNIPEVEIITMKPATFPIKVDLSAAGKDKNLKTKSGLSCEERCPVLVTGSPVHFWIISTIAAAVLTVIFLILGVIIMIKYYRLSSSPKVEYMSAMPHSEEIYVEVDGKRRENCMYMSLEKSKRPVLQSVNMTS